MHWFEGSIPDAIQETKANRKLLLVFVLDSTEDSVRMTSLLNEDVIGEVLTPDNVVALKLETGSESFAQFSVFYPVLILPSIYYIGDNGTPLEVVGGYQTVEPFLERTRNALKMHEEGAATTVSMSVPEPRATNSNASAVPSSVGAGSSESIEQDSPSTSATASAPSASVEERMLTAKEKIEAQNRERIETEKEENKKREVERRKLGKEMAEAQREKEEAAMRRRAEELAKDRADEKLAREKIKEQIERDRKERQAKFEEEKRTKEQKAKEKQDEKQAAEAAAAAALQERIRSVSRIQFRLPDGGAITREFSVDDSYADLRLFISDELRSRGLEDFDLVHSFTRRQFESTDLTSTLTELDLAGPNALIVVPRRGGCGSGGGGADNSSFSLIAVFWLVMAPFIFVVNLFRDLIYGTPPKQQLTTPQPQASANEASTPRRGAEDMPRSQGARQRPSPQANIHRLRRHDSDSDSDDPTWNGNSTQQL